MSTALIDYQIYGDSVSLNGAPALAAIGTRAYVPINGIARIRLDIGTNDTVASAFTLQYRVNGGAWVTATAATAARIVNSTFFADAAVTTKRLTGTPFNTGEGITTARNTASYTLAGSGTYEFEWNVQFAQFNINDTVEFHVVPTGAIYMTDVKTATVTISAYNGANTMLIPTMGEVNDGTQIGAETAGVAVPAIRNCNDFSLKMMKKLNPQTIKTRGSKWLTGRT